MKLLGRYLMEIILSSVSPSYYRKITQRSCWYAVGYFTFFTFLHGIAASWFAFHETSSRYEPTLKQIAGSLPVTEIGLSEGRFYSNLPEPYALGNREFALVVNTTGTGADLSTFKSGLLVSERKILYKKDAFETREYNFSKLPDFRFNSLRVLRFFHDKKDSILWGLFALLALLLFPLFWWSIFPLIPLFALLLLLVSRFLKGGLQYTQLLSLSLYSLTLPTLVSTSLLLWNPARSSHFFLVYLLWSLVIVYGIRNAPQPTPQGAGAS